MIYQKIFSGTYWVRMYLYGTGSLEEVFIIFCLTEFTTRSLEKKNAELSSSKYVLANQVDNEISFSIEHWMLRLETALYTLLGTSMRRETRSGWSSTPPSRATCFPHTRQGTQSFSFQANLEIPFLDSTNRNSIRSRKILTLKNRYLWHLLKSSDWKFHLRAVACRRWWALLNMKHLYKVSSSYWTIILSERNLHT